MDSETLLKLAESRVLISDTKALKKVIHAFHALLSPDAQGDKLYAAHASFDVALSQFAQSLARADHIAAVTASEVAAYRTEARALERTSHDTSAALGELGAQLERARRERARRIEYDARARVIQRLPDRHKGLEQQQRLESDIALLESESRTYAETWQARKVAFDAIVDGLQVMQEAIRDEKAEQDRRRALDEDDGDAEADAALDDDASAAAAPPAPAPARAAAAGAALAPPAGLSLDPRAQEFVPGGPGGPQGDADADGDGDVPMGDLDLETEAEQLLGPPRTASRASREEGQVTDEMVESTQEEEDA
ncbi:hypothetical protein JCM8208_007732 [Rhodotorula glutinis]